MPARKKFGQHDSALGGPGATRGLPRFETADFSARFPFADITLKDKDVPLAIQIKGWSPFIPTDEDNSSLPVGGLEYHFKNNSTKTEECVFSYSSRHFLNQPATKTQLKQLRTVLLFLLMVLKPIRRNKPILPYILTMMLQW
ncbi:GH116 family glycosyl-hydrolase [Mucilaginibacter humi]|uniref:GH116 family glycosyl-hydrolase n=1 Tax=Mucilaginibacter humi TaxID=2732510 RepID=UPI00293BE75B|nr:GH116 family glycosyl-hydrolase [Mucilaginibacter humi]